MRAARKRPLRYSNRASCGSLLRRSSCGGEHEAREVRGRESVGETARALLDSKGQNGPVEAVQHSVVEPEPVSAQLSDPAPTPRARPAHPSGARPVPAHPSGARPVKQSPPALRPGEGEGPVHGESVSVLSATTRRSMTGPGAAWPPLHARSAWPSCGSVFRPPHEGQRPRSLQLRATRRSSRQTGHQTRAKPRSRRPHREPPEAGRGT